MSGSRLHLRIGQRHVRALVVTTPTLRTAGPPPCSLPNVNLTSSPARLGHKGCAMVPADALVLRRQEAAEPGALRISRSPSMSTSTWIVIGVIALLIVWIIL